MNPYMLCPGCNSGLQLWSSGGLHQDFCIERCNLRFYQTYVKPGDALVTNVSFHTKHFHYIKYFANSNYFPGITHIYHSPFPKGQSVQSPVFTVKDFQLDFDNLDKLDNKYLTYVTFS